MAEDIFKLLQSSDGIGRIHTLKRPDFITTNIAVLDRKIFRVGGLPRRKITEIWGSENAGKTAHAGIIIACFQKQYPNEKCIYIDTENAVDVDFFHRLGVDTSEEKFLYVGTGDIITAGQYIVMGLHDPSVGLIIVDSMANLELPDNADLTKFTKKRRGSSAGEVKTWMDRKMADSAGAHTSLAKVVNYHLPYSNAALLYTNQIKADIGGWAPVGGTNDKKGGCHAYKHNVHISIRVTKKADIYADDKVTIIGAQFGYSTKNKDTRNKLGQVFKTDTTNHPIILFDNMYENLLASSVADRAIMAGLVRKAGAWLVCEINTKKGKKQLFKVQGKEKYMELLASNPGIREKLKGLVEKREQKKSAN